MLSYKWGLVPIQALFSTDKKKLGLSFLKKPFLNLDLKKQQ